MFYYTKTVGVYFMEWTKDLNSLLAFDKWIMNSSDDLGDFISKAQPNLPVNDSVLLFYTFGKFSHLYKQHRSRNLDEDLALSLHRVLNTVMEEDSTRVLFARMAEAATKGAVGA